MIELISQPAFDEFRGKRIKPSPDIKVIQKLIAGFVRLQLQITIHQGRVKWVMSLTQ